MPFYEVVAYRRIQNAAAPPDFVELGRIIQTSSDEGGGLAWSRELYGDSFITVATSPANVVSDIGDCLLDLRAAPLELGIFRDGVLMNRGPVIAVQVEGNTLIINARGLGYYMRYMVMEADATYTGTDPVAVLVDMINDYQAQTRGNFGLITTGTTASSFTVTKAYLETDLINIADEARALSASTGYFDLQFDPTTRELRTWNGFKGVDKPNVVFDASSIVHPNLSMTVTAGMFGTRSKISGIVGAGPNPTIHEATGDITALDSFGRAYVAEAVSGAGTSGEMNAIAGQTAVQSAALQINPPKEFFSRPEISVLEADVGDIVRFVYDAGFGEITYIGRLKNQFVSVQEGGQDKLTIEFVEEFVPGETCE